MAESIVLISQQLTKPIKITKWKVAKGNTISIGRVLFLYHFEDETNPEQRKLKSTKAGTVDSILAPEGAIVRPGENVLNLKRCKHPTIMNDMCAECGTDLRNDDLTTTASVPMIHTIPDLKVSEESAQELGKADNERLLADRKLVLLVDLDQTLIHTTNDNIPSNIKDVYHFQLYGPNSPWYHTRLRPGTHQFLKNVSPLFELHICTFGARNYAHTITMFLDSDQTYFSHRILSRDECFDPTSKKANLKALFPCGDNMVCIIDDREDVWNHATNLIHVKPYHFFQHTGDINAPPDLEKRENDDKVGIDLSRIKWKGKLKLNGKNVKNKKIYNKDQLKLSTNGDQEVSCNNLKKGSVEENGTENNLSGSQDVESNISEEKSLKKEANCIDKKESVIINDISAESVNNLTKVDENSVNNKDVLIEIDVSHEITDNSSKVKPTKEDISPKNEDNLPQINNSVNNENVSDNNSVKNEDISNKIDKPIKNNDNSEKIEDISDKIDNSIQTEDNSAKIETDAVKTEVTAKTDPKSEATKKTECIEEVKENPDELIEVDDPDDYLLYLEEVLRRIHKSFYEEFDKLESGEVPDLKQVIPEVRSDILKGSKLVFSGLVPTHIKLEQSRAFQVARSLGAIVTQDFDEESTHLVAVRPGTAKVNAARRRKNLKIVTPDWLWSCAERWEHVDEILYPLNSKGSKNRHPPPHCSSPEHVPRYPTHEAPVSRKRTPSGRFMDTINPLMSFSSDDIADMDKEVEDILDDESESEDEGKKVSNTVVADKIGESSSSSEESLTGEYPRGFKRSREKLKEEAAAETNDVEAGNDSSLDEYPSAKFRRGEELDSDLDIGQGSNSEGSVEPPDEVDDGEWNMMGAALEREFLSNN